jgi:hypothetical protein
MLNIVKHKYENEKMDSTVHYVHTGTQCLVYFVL